MESAELFIHSANVHGAGANDRSRLFFDLDIGDILYFVAQKEHNFKEGLTYDDVLLAPKRSPLHSRKEVDLGIQLSEGLKLNLPIISAPMDTVTESAMAIVLARFGALGVIHRFNSIEKQIEEVKKVKRMESYFLEKPLAINPSFTLKDLLARAEKVGNSSFLVVDESNVLLGLISKRDYIFESNLNKKVSELMTPFGKLVCVSEFISLGKAKEFFRTHKIEKLPVVDKQRKVKGLITAKDVIQNYNVRAIRDKKGRLLVGAALGVKDDFLERASALVGADVDILALDIAHGHLEICLDATRKIKKAFPQVTLMVGNIATKEGAQDLKEAGADIIKVGVGAGAVCTTRIVTGCGMPQLTAVIEAKQGAQDIPVVADGGIRSSGDMAKALAAGASAVMLGSLLAGTDEAPGELTMWNGRKVKLCRGMASLAAYKDKNKEVDGQELEYFTAEGVDQGFVPYKGTAKDLLYSWERGMKSGFSYCGARNTRELWLKSEFIKITSAGMKESGPHDVMTA